jgi:hypothetical protein
MLIWLGWTPTSRASFLIPYFFTRSGILMRPL